MDPVISGDDDRAVIPVGPSSRAPDDNPHLAPNGDVRGGAGTAKLSRKGSEAGRQRDGVQHGSDDEGPASRKNQMSAPGFCRSVLLRQSSERTPSTRPGRDSQLVVNLI